MPPSHPQRRQHGLIAVAATGRIALLGPSQPYPDADAPPFRVLNLSRRVAGDASVWIPARARQGCGLDAGLAEQALLREARVDDEATSIAHNSWVDRLALVHAWLGRIQASILDASQAGEPVVRGGYSICSLLGSATEPSTVVPCGPFTAFQSPQRRTALELCGWADAATPGGAGRVLSAILRTIRQAPPGECTAAALGALIPVPLVQRCVAEGDVERGAAIALYHGYSGAAVHLLTVAAEELRRSGKRTSSGPYARASGGAPAAGATAEQMHAELLQLTAMGIAGYPGPSSGAPSPAGTPTPGLAAAAADESAIAQRQLWVTSCRTLCGRIDAQRHPYLRMALTVLVEAADPDFDDGTHPSVVAPTVDPAAAAAAVGRAHGGGSGAPLLSAPASSTLAPISPAAGVPVAPRSEGSGVKPRSRAALHPHSTATLVSASPQLKAQRHRIGTVGPKAGGAATLPPGSGHLVHFTALQQRSSGGGISGSSSTGNVAGLSLSTGTPESLAGSRSLGPSTGPLYDTIPELGLDLEDMPDFRLDDGMGPPTAAAVAATAGGVVAPASPERAADASHARIDAVAHEPPPQQRHRGLGAPGNDEAETEEAEAEEDVYLEITLHDRIAFALRFHRDEALPEYLRLMARDCLQRGRVDAIPLAGLTPTGARLVQRYLDAEEGGAQQGDVQTAALLGAYMIRAAQVSLALAVAKDRAQGGAGRAATGAVNSPLGEVLALLPEESRGMVAAAWRWVQSYRELLSRLRLWTQRAAFDVQRAKLFRVQFNAQPGGSASAAAAMTAAAAPSTSSSRGEEGAEQAAYAALLSLAAYAGGALPQPAAPAVGPPLAPGALLSSREPSSLARSMAEGVMGLGATRPLLSLSCPSCRTSLSLPSLVSRAAPNIEWLSKQRPTMLCCPSCKKGLPQCALCLMPMGCINPHMQLLHGMRERQLAQAAAVAAARGAVGAAALAPPSRPDEDASSLLLPFPLTGARTGDDCYSAVSASSSAVGAAPNSQLPASGGEGEVGGQPLPRHGGANAATVGYAQPVASLSLPGLLSLQSRGELRNAIDFAEFWCWCMGCGHGGHASHLAEWFASKHVCPVAECYCNCVKNDPGLAEAMAQQLQGVRSGGASRWGIPFQGGRLQQQH